MADIFHYYPINAAAEKVFELISTPKCLDIWWSKRTKGRPAKGETYQFHFSPQYNWEAIVSKYKPHTEFELSFTDADEDWVNSKVGFTLINKGDTTDIHFYHTGWKEDNEHYRISNYCWAMYLRLLKRYAEFGETVAYEERLNV